jgi:hypothetical protein
VELYNRASRSFTRLSNISDSCSYYFLTPPKRKTTKQFEQEQQQERRDREAILDERANLRGFFPADYLPDISVCGDGNVEVMFKLTIPQARSLALLLKEHHL